MKWDYNVINLAEMHKEYNLSFKAMLNTEGAQEWELVSVDNGIAYFKRPLRSKSEDEIMKHFENRQSLV